jgi:hypothetical protein
LLEVVPKFPLDTNGVFAEPRRSSSKFFGFDEQVGLNSNSFGTEVWKNVFDEHPSLVSRKRPFVRLLATFLFSSRSNGTAPVFLEETDNLSVGISNDDFAGRQFVALFAFDSSHGDSAFAFEKPGGPIEISQRRSGSPANGYGLVDTCHLLSSNGIGVSTYTTTSCAVALSISIGIGVLVSMFTMGNFVLGHTDI